MEVVIAVVALVPICSASLIHSIMNYIIAEHTNIRRSQNSLLHPLSCQKPGVGRQRIQKNRHIQNGNSSMAWSL